jgi:hypothetical protein
MLKARRKSKAPVGPFDLRTRKLPGGTEMEAIASGIALERERGIGFGAGYTKAAALANRNIISDATTQQPWIVGDAATGLLRSHNAPQLFDAFRNEMEEIFTHELNPSNITPQEFARGHAWKKVLNIENNEPLTGSFEDLGKHYVTLKRGVFLTHRLDTTAQPVRNKAAPSSNALTFDYHMSTPARIRTTTVSPARFRTAPVTISYFD